jgi:hypothetical protein
MGETAHLGNPTGLESYSQECGYLQIAILICQVSANVRGCSGSSALSQDEKYFLVNNLCSGTDLYSFPEMTLVSQITEDHGAGYAKYVGFAHSASLILQGTERGVIKATLLSDVSVSFDLFHCNSTHLRNITQCKR